MTILSIGKWRTNGHLIASCADLGYLRAEWLTLDPTYGKGTFWRQWQPARLLRADTAPADPAVMPWDFTRLPLRDRSVDAVVFDPPYKLNGRPSGPDARYGVQVPARWKDRMALCHMGLEECARVLGDGHLLMKCQDQVSSGRIRWQSYEFTKHAEHLGLGLVDRFEFLGRRAQPGGRRQVHAHRASSQLLVFKRGWVSA